MTDQERLVLMQQVETLTTFLQSFFTVGVGTGYFFLSKEFQLGLEPDTPIYLAAKDELLEICHKLWPT